MGYAAPVYALISLPAGSFIGIAGTLYKRLTVPYFIAAAQGSTNNYRKPSGRSKDIYYLYTSIPHEVTINLPGKMQVFPLINPSFTIVPVIS